MVQQTAPVSKQNGKQLRPLRLPLFLKALLQSHPTLSTQTKSSIVEDEPASTDQFIREIIKLQDPNILEAGVATSLKILNSLSERFSRYAVSSADAKS
jgi:hypothetical protein